MRGRIYLCVGGPHVRRRPIGEGAARVPDLHGNPGDPLRTRGNAHRLRDLVASSRLTPVPNATFVQDATPLPTRVKDALTIRWQVLPPYRTRCGGELSHSQAKNFRSCFHAHGNSGSATAVVCGKIAGSPFSWVRKRFRVRAGVRTLL